MPFKAIATYAFALDDETNSSSADGTNIAWNHTVTATEGNRALFVGIAYWSCDVISTSAVTFNGDAMELIDDSCTAATHYVAIYKLMNPDTGTHEVSITVSGNPYSLIGGAWSFTGVNQSTPIGTMASGTGFDNVATLEVAGASGNICIAIAGNGGTETFTGDVGENQISDWVVAPDMAGTGLHGTMAGATITMSASMSGNKTFVIGGIAVKGN